MVEWITITWYKLTGHVTTRSKRTKRAKPNTSCSGLLRQAPAAAAAAAGRPSLELTLLNCDHTADHASPVCVVHSTETATSRQQILNRHRFSKSSFL